MGGSQTVVFGVSYACAAHDGFEPLASVDPRILGYQRLKYRSFGSISTIWHRLSVRLKGSFYCE
jgi:hypothetical protein